MRAEQAVRIGAVIKAQAEVVLGPAGSAMCEASCAARPELQAADIQYILGRLAQHTDNVEVGRAFQLRVLSRLRGKWFYQVHTHLWSRAPLAIGALYSRVSKAKNSRQRWLDVNCSGPEN